MFFSAEPEGGVPEPWVIRLSNRPFTQSGRPGVSQELNSPSCRLVGNGSSGSTGSPWWGAVGVHHTNHGSRVLLNPVITSRACSATTSVE